MPKFFIENKTESKNINESIVLTAENAKHVNVLRYKVGDEILICDSNSTDYTCTIEQITKTEIRLKILHKAKCCNEPNVKITLFQAIPKSDKMETVIQKCVELGVYSIVPVVTENTVVKLNKNIKNKIERYQKTSEAAAKQCERGIIPFVSEPVSFDVALEMLSKMDAAYVAYEKESKKTLRDCRLMQNIGIFIGPEGGFSPHEIEKCNQKGIDSVSLGKRILRTETAGLVAVTILLFIREEI